MKLHKKRIPFGAEKQLLNSTDTTCPSCQAKRESLHLPGCSGEECPECGRSLIGCCCDILSPYDAEQVIQGLYGQVESLEMALSIASQKGCPLTCNSSYLQHAVMKYIFNNVPEDARQEISEAFHVRFPGLVPLLQDENGRGYYTAEQLAEALDIPLHEVHERIDAMVSSGQVIKTSQGKPLRKVH